MHERLQLGLVSLMAEVAVAAAHAAAAPPPDAPNNSVPSRNPALSRRELPPRPRNRRAAANATTIEQSGGADQSHRTKPNSFSCRLPTKEQ